MSDLDFNFQLSEISHTKNRHTCFILDFLWIHLLYKHDIFLLKVLPGHCGVVLRKTELESNAGRRGSTLWIPVTQKNT